MRILNRSLLPLTLFFGTFLFSQKVAQNIAINKNNISRIFKKSIYRPNKKIITVISSPWFTDNTNGKYYKSDTIKFINTRFHNDNFCDVINWTLYKKNNFIRSFGNYCKEPPSVKVTTLNDHFTMNINEIGTETYLTIYNQKKLIEKFKIITLQEEQTLSFSNEKKYTLTLIRIK